MLTNQDRPTKLCPICNSGRIYTGTGQSLNGKIGNVQACAECVTKSMIQEFLNRRAD